MAGVSENHTATGDGEAVIEFGSTDATANHGLPKTCTIIEKNDEREVYVVGTAHFSKESQEDVALVSEIYRSNIPPALSTVYYTCNYLSSTSHCFLSVPIIKDRS